MAGNVLVGSHQPTSQDDHAYSTVDDDMQQQQQMCVLSGNPANDGKIFDPNQQPEPDDGHAYSNVHYSHHQAAATLGHPAYGTAHGRGSQVK